MQVGEALSLGVRRDFTFVHPEVLEERCAVDGAAITLNNKINHERWRAFIIPGFPLRPYSPPCDSLKKFYDQGGTVIATTRLPDRAAEFGADAEVRIGAEIFGPVVAQQEAAPRVSASSTWVGYDPVKTMDGSTRRGGMRPMAARVRNGWKWILAKRRPFPAWW